MHGLEELGSVMLASDRTLVKDSLDVLHDRLP
jgi:hypothetical protein